MSEDKPTKDEAAKKKAPAKKAAKKESAGDAPQEVEIKCKCGWEGPRSDMVPDKVLGYPAYCPDCGKLHRREDQDVEAMAHILWKDYSGGKTFPTDRDEAEKWRRLGRIAVKQRGGTGH